MPIEVVVELSNIKGSGTLVSSRKTPLPRPRRRPSNNSSIMVNMGHNLNTHSSIM
jgi:hypothetical protein